MMLQGNLLTPRTTDVSGVHVKIIVVGDSGVGKSSMCWVASGYDFDQGGQFEAPLRLDGRCGGEILDIGALKHDGKVLYSAVDVILVAFCNRTSLDNVLSTWLAGPIDKPVVLCQTKMDLELEESERVTDADIQAVINQHKMIQCCFRTSARKRIGTSAVVESCARISTNQLVGGPFWDKPFDVDEEVWVTYKGSEYRGSVTRARFDYTSVFCVDKPFTFVNNLTIKNRAEIRRRESAIEALREALEWIDVDSETFDVIASFCRTERKYVGDWFPVLVQTRYTRYVKPVTPKT